MNGVCHAEGTNWTSGCAEYTCMLRSTGYRSVEINKGLYCIKVSEQYISWPTGMSYHLQYTMHMSFRSTEKPYIEYFKIEPYGLLVDPLSWLPEKEP